jgi:lipopolysaccharide transport system permease protein
MMLMLPVFVAIAFLASVGTGLWLASLNVKYRDFRYIVPFIVQFGLYISPVGFSSGIVPEQWRFIYALNPMVGVIDGFRWPIWGGRVQTIHARFFALLGFSYAIVANGDCLFPQNGADVCRCDLSLETGTGYEN